MLIQFLLISFPLLKEFIEDLQIFEPVLGCFKRLCPLFLVTDRFQSLFGCFGIIPETGSRGEFLFLLN
jgi:hypothetical protein